MSGLSMGMEEVARDFLFLFSLLFVSPELIWLLTIATITNYRTTAFPSTSFFILLFIY